MIRLDKYLADMGIGTRSAVKQMIRKGQVQVNQETAARPELKIDEQNDKVQVNGQMIGMQPLNTICSISLQELCPQQKISVIRRSLI